MAKVFISYNYIKELEEDFLRSNCTLCDDHIEGACDACKDSLMVFVNSLLENGHLLITDRYPSRMDERENSVWDAENVVRF